MGDLAQAIVSLSAAARGRRQARKQLREAAAIVARSVAQHLRAGDKVVIETAESTQRYAVENLDWAIGLTRETTKVLCRNGSPLYAPEGVTGGGRYVETEYDEESDESTERTVSIADEEDLMAFGDEALLVAGEFKELCEQQEREFEAGASKIAKIVPNGGQRYTLEQWAKKLTQFVQTMRVPFEIEKVQEGFVLGGAAAAVLVRELEAHRVEIVSYPQLQLLFGPEPIDKFDKRLHDAAQIIGGILRGSGPEAEPTPDALFEELVKRYTSLGRVEGSNRYVDRTRSGSADIRYGRDKQVGRLELFDAVAQGGAERILEWTTNVRNGRSGSVAHRIKSLSEAISLIDGA